MKPIRALDGPTPGLAEYLATVEQPDWEEFRSHEAGASYRELIEALTARQHGLCGYCEIELQDNDRQVEHFEPRSRAPDLALDASNLIAACTGGSSRRFGSDRPAHDEDRYLPPPRRNLSCGEAKGDRAAGGLIDPRETPPDPIFDVRPDGLLRTNDAACDAAGLAPAHVADTINVLGLNVQRLRRARERFLADLAEQMEPIADDDAAWRWIGTLLRPNASGSLRRFFTTTRSYFGELAERVLKTGSADWVDRKAAADSGTLEHDARETG